MSTLKLGPYSRPERTVTIPAQRVEVIEVQPRMVRYRIPNGDVHAAPHDVFLREYVPEDKP